MNKLMKILTVSAICLCGCSTKTETKTDTVKYEEYETYYQMVLDNQKFSDTSDHFTISLEMSEVPDGSYRYAIIVDEAQISMYEVVMIAVENHTAFSDATTMMPSLGIFEDPYNLIPNQVNKEEGYAKGLAMSGESDTDGIDLEILVQYKNQTRTKTTREFFSYHLDTDGYEYQKAGEE